jgi:hypothetical protein
MRPRKGSFYVAEICGDREPEFFAKQKGFGAESEANKVFTFFRKRTEKRYAAERYLPTFSYLSLKK